MVIITTLLYSTILDVINMIDMIDKYSFFPFPLFSKLAADINFFLHFGGKLKKLFENMEMDRRIGID